MAVPKSNCLNNFLFSRKDSSVEVSLPKNRYAPKNIWFKDMNLSKTELFKGYLRYKMITSQNMTFEAQIKNFFISYKNYVPFSRYSSFSISNNPVIYQICDVTMSISTWDKVHFWIYLLNHKSWSHQTWPADRYKQVQ